MSCEFVENAPKSSPEYISFSLDENRKSLNGALREAHSFIHSFGEGNGVTGAAPVWALGPTGGETAPAGHHAAELQLVLRFD
jgi:hypothetical protein